MNPRARPLRWLAAMGVCLAAAAVILVVVIATSAAPATPWWQATGFAGQRVDAVAASGSSIHAIVAGAAYASRDAGRSWQPEAAMPAVPAPAGGWVVYDGRPAEVTPRGIQVDPGAPALGSSGLVTGPQALPDAAVAVGASSSVWRRDASGTWSRALVLLPDTLSFTPPRVTALASFSDEPLSPAVYLGTDGYGVLVSENGGEDWVRFNSGLPGHVTALATDAHDRDVFAATDDGLYLHRLQAQPAPPPYHDADYWWRVAGMVAVTLAASGAGVMVLRRGLRRTATGPG